LLPWTFFSSSVNQGGQSLVTNSSLLNKVYCPREVFPASSCIVALIDMLISSGVLIVLFLAYGYAPKATSVWVPMLLLIQLAFVFGVTFAVSSVLVYFRDLRHALPLIIQLGLFATPVAWPIDKFVHAQWQPLYAALNPLAAVIDGYRRTVLYGQAPDWRLVWPAAISAGVILIGGFVLLKRLEPRFADVA
jgi:ABC-2 type transport system permease protein/lipopolysaccharide transport system permease protein